MMMRNLIDTVDGLLLSESVEDRLVERLLGADRRDVKYYINPRYDEVMSLLNKQREGIMSSKNPELRGYMIAGNLYVWDARFEIHRLGRMALHRDMGIGKDPYSGRPLVIKLREDGSIHVMLGNIRRGWFVGISPETVNKFARLRAAVTPPTRQPETPEHQSPGLFEAKPELVPVKDEEVSVWVNPSARQFQNIIQSYGVIRGFILPPDKVYVWGAYDATHDDIEDQMKWPDRAYRFIAASSQATLDEENDWQSGRFLVYESKGNYFISAARLDYVMGIPAFARLFPAPQYVGKNE